MCSRMRPSSAGPDTRRDRWSPTAARPWRRCPHGYRRSGAWVRQLADALDGDRHRLSGGDLTGQHGHQKTTVGERGLAGQRGQRLPAGAIDKLFGGAGETAVPLLIVDEDAAESADGRAARYGLSRAGRRSPSGDQALRPRSIPNSIESTSASQLASMMFSETPILPQLSSPSLASSRTRVTAPVPLVSSRMRTL